jgi:uncharacterized protein (DUF2267 family)
MAKRTSSKTTRSKSSKDRTPQRTISGAVNRATAGRRSKAGGRGSTRTMGGRTRTSAPGTTRNRTPQTRRPAGQMSEQAKRRTAEGTQNTGIARRITGRGRGSEQQNKKQRRTAEPRMDVVRRENVARDRQNVDEKLYQRTTNYRAQKRREEDVFASTIQKANLWLKQVMNELGTDDRHRAYAALKAVLHTLRDRLTVEEAVDLSAQLPILIRGIYFEGWTPSGKPIKYSKQEFIGTVDGYFVNVSGINAGDIIRAVFKMLQESIPEGEIRHIIDTMPEEFGEFWKQDELILQSS